MDKRVWTNLALGLALSSALHAAVLTSLEPVASDGAGRRPALSVKLDEHRGARPEAPEAKSEKRARGGRPRAALPVRYLPAGEVDAPARPRGTVPLIYPENPFIWKLGGVVRLRLLINEHGTVDDVHVVSAEPEGDFEDAAISAARRMVYDPALRNGRPVKSEKLIEVTFDPHETASR